MTEKMACSNCGGEVRMEDWIKVRIRRWNPYLSATEDFCCWQCFVEWTEKENNREAPDETPGETNSD